MSTPEPEATRKEKKKTEEYEADENSKKKSKSEVTSPYFSKTRKQTEEGPEGTFILIKSDLEPLHLIKIVKQSCYPEILWKSSSSLKIMKFRSSADASDAEIRLLCAKILASTKMTESDCKKMLNNNFGEIISFTVQRSDVFKKPSLLTIAEAGVQRGKLGEFKV